MGFFFLVATAFPYANHVHWGSTGNPLDGLTLTWHSAGASDSVRWGYTTLYEKGGFAGTRRADYSGNLFSYIVPSPIPDTIIHFSIKNMAWEVDRTFKTSIDTATASFSFIAGGDSRTNLEDWRTISNLIKYTPADFHIFVGDLVNDGTSVDDWNSWYEYGAPFLQAHQIYYCRGNHEEDGLIFANQFSIPGKVFYYSFKFGNALFICLNSDDPTNIDQIDFLRTTLTTQKQLWNFVFFHTPFFTVGGHSGEMDPYLKSWWALFDSAGVDAVINGHTHHYMRSKPINYEVKTTAGVAEYGSGPGQGRLEVVTGAYGAPLYACDTAWFSETCFSQLHYTKWTISGNALHMDAVDANGKIFDSVTIRKKTPDHAATARSRPAGMTISISPNPTFFPAQISFSCSAAGPWDVSVYSITGEKIFQKSAGPGGLVRWGPQDKGCSVYPVLFSFDKNKYLRLVSVLK